ncbi:hypothetical protein ACQP1P_28585 [Dactylosporangium sp. CA-052675]|uniref:hypothetical protein n=1 Tax=Dactylosporangium sp. CA-052675 TaxID=3239927 RepID=UPI003D8A3E86
MECKFATKEEVSDIVGEPVLSFSVAVGGCWYRLSGSGIGTNEVKITVFYNKVFQPQKGEVAVSGLGGTASWDDDLGMLTVQLGKNVLWTQVGSIKADDKLERAKRLVALVRKRI